MACGVKADTSILPDSVSAPRAIDIDDRCRTSDKDIYAAGDCAQHNGLNYALWSEAMVQGRTAGANAAADLTGKELRHLPDAEHSSDKPFRFRRYGKRS